MSFTVNLFQHKFNKWDILDGETHKARFGLSLASVGNINLDGMSQENPKGYQGTTNSLVLYY